jgi:hypothetical protein
MATTERRPYTSWTPGFLRKANQANYRIPQPLLVIAFGCVTVALLYPGLLVITHISSVHAGWVSNPPLPLSLSGTQWQQAIEANLWGSLSSS